VPLLQWMGLTLDPIHAAAQSLTPYPNMLRWLRQAPDSPAESSSGCPICPP
jgi:hypothetical protein